VPCPRTQEANLPAYLSSHYTVLKLNVKQGSWEYQLFKTFVPTRRGMESRSTDY